MKLEPVAWPNGCNKSAVNALRYLASNVRPSGGQDHYNAEHLLQIARELESHAKTPLYAIPDGYVVVPVSLLKRANAAMMEWAAKYGDHNPQWLPPARVAELSAEIEAMIAAKEQS